jgi:hypothetical protein
MMLRAKSFSLGPPAAKPPKIGVIASPFLAAARPNSNTTLRHHQRAEQVDG